MRFFFLFKLALLYLSSNIFWKNVCINDKNVRKFKGSFSSVLCKIISYLKFLRKVLLSCSVAIYENTECARIPRTRRKFVCLFYIKLRRGKYIAINYEKSDILSIIFLMPSLYIIIYSNASHVLVLNFIYR